MHHPRHEEGGRTRLLIFSKLPVPGAVKTRLVPPLTYEDACDLASAFLSDALARYPALPGIDTWLYLADDHDAATSIEHALAALFPTLPGSRITVRRQSEGSLGKRLLAAFTEAFDDGCDAVCAVGSDHPTLPADYIADAFSQLDAYDLVVGPVEDGGYYLIGMRRLREELFLDLPYSTPVLFDSLMAIANAAALRTAVLPRWYDVDDAASLQRLWSDRAMLADGSATARALDRLASKINLAGAETGAVR